jgi:hypothetical protein
MSSAMSSAIPCGANVRGRRPRRQGIVTAPSDCHFPWTCVCGPGARGGDDVVQGRLGDSGEKSPSRESSELCWEVRRARGQRWRTWKGNALGGGPWWTAGGLHNPDTAESRCSPKDVRSVRSVRAVTGSRRLQAPVIPWDDGGCLRESGRVSLLGRPGGLLLAGSRKNCCARG